MLQNEIQHFRQIERPRQRSPDVIQRFRELAAVLFALVERGIVDGNRHLIGQRLQNRHILHTEGPPVTAVNVEDAYHPVAHRQRQGTFGLAIGNLLDPDISFFL